MYKVIWKEEAERNLRKISRTNPSTAKKIEDQVKKHLASHPEHNGQPLEYQWQGFYRYSVDDYRVIYEIRKKEVVIIVVEVGKRQSRQPDSIYNKKPPRRTSSKKITAIKTKNNNR